MRKTYSSNLELHGGDIDDSPYPLITQDYLNKLFEYEISPEGSRQIADSALLDLASMDLI